MPVEIGLLVFPNVQQLDLTGPYEVFASWPEARVRLIWKDRTPDRFGDRPAAHAGRHIRRLSARSTSSACPAASESTHCSPTKSCWRSCAVRRRRRVSSPRYARARSCSGAAGLLSGKRATTHWASHDLLAAFGAIPTQARVVRDGALMTGGGVTAGIDFALTLVAETCRVSDSAGDPA